MTSGPPDDPDLLYYNWKGIPIASTESKRRPKATIPRLHVCSIRHGIPAACVYSPKLCLKPSDGEDSGLGPEEDTGSQNGEDCLSAADAAVDTSIELE